MSGNLILGIESSCDDTAVALVDGEGVVHASEVVSQTEIHAEWGGVYPEFASRAHVRAIVPTIDRAMNGAGATQDDLKAIAVTRGPGLIGSLLVGLNAASGLATAWGKDIIGVNHLRGHLRSADLEEKRVEFPATILLVSGGHTILAHMTDAASISILGRTRDDSVGEAYDKVARMMDLGYPGGPVIDKLAKEGQDTIDLPRPMIREGLDFSFSGLKSSVVRHLEKNPDIPPADMAASFVASCMDVLLVKCRRALEAKPARSLVVVGGVAASPQLRAGAQEVTEDMGVALCLPPLRWSTDNAAMIALAGWDYVALGSAPEPAAQPGLSIEQL
ncbi:MAG: tRNA (adenosine(37)-N6)-threonylcarbamoyltransferase complex transferase subunit TsaD [Rhodospirillaceae bacterium]|nr:tRNA (adenosine(37)-N6)-threonylcarbamoyltransferase complex transferase subunit TsaD [Rhodospirillaceae bacterium]